MGNRCFRPSIQNDSPVYKNSLQKAYIDAQIIYQQKNTKQTDIVLSIKQNDNRKGNLKKLMDHLVSHKQNITLCLGQCIKKISTIQKMHFIIINSLFAQNLVNLLASSKKNTTSIVAQESKRTIRHSFQQKYFSFKNLKNDMQDFSNLLRQCETSLFQMIYKILVYNNQQEINLIISSSLIMYANEYSQKFRDHKNVKNILDLYLDHILQNKIEKVLKQSKKHFEAYECLLSKLNVQFIDCAFVQAHLKYFLNIWCDLSDLKKSNQNIDFNQNLSYIRLALEGIIQIYINISENKCFQQVILKSIMYRYDIENFQQMKIQSIQRVIQSSLNVNQKQYFMNKWLNYLLDYLFVKETQYEELWEIGNFHNYYQMKSLFKNILAQKNFINALKTVKRWISNGTINLAKVLDYSSDKFFCAIITNIYQKKRSEYTYEEALDIFNSILESNPQKCGKFICLITRIIHAKKNQSRHQVQQLMQLTQSLRSINFELTCQEKEIIYAPIAKKQSIYKAIWLIQVASQYLQKLRLKDWNKKIQNQQDMKTFCQYLAHISRFRKKHQTQSTLKFEMTYWKNLQHLCNAIAEQNEQILLHWLKHNQQILYTKGEEVKIFPSIEINMIIITKSIENKKKMNSKTFIKLTQLQDRTLVKMKDQIKPNSEANNQIYEEFRSYSHLFQIHIEKAKESQIYYWMTIQGEQEELQIKQEANSVKLSDHVYQQSHDEDSQFREVFNILSKK